MRTYVPPIPHGEEKPPEPDTSVTLGNEPEVERKRRQDVLCRIEEVDLPDRVHTPAYLPEDLGVPPSANTSHYAHPLAEEGSAEFLLSQMPPPMREQAKKIPKAYLAMDPIELRRMVKPSQTLEGLRTSFWAEYNLATNSGRKMVFARVWAGICTDIFFYRVVETPGLFTFVLTPPLNYRVSMDAMLKLSLERMHEILNVPMFNRDGKFLPDVAKIVQKAYEMIAYRQLGAPVQKNLTLTGSLTDAHSDIGALKHEQQTRVAELERREREMAAKFVEASPVVPEELDEFTRATLNKG